MNLENFLYSNFKFNENEDLLKFKFKMMNYVLLIAFIFSTLFGVLHDLGLNDIGYFHSRVDYAYGLVSLILIFFLRMSKDNYEKAVHILLVCSMLTFISALINVPQDEFRIIWFYLLIFLAYILSGSITGMVYTLLSISVVLVSHTLTDLQLSQIAINSAILGLLIGGLLSSVYTNKVSDYENALYEKTETLKLLSTTDALTGVMNRRGFYDLTEHYFKVAKRYNKNISLFIIDIDYFKLVNDNYGHLVGDELLISFVNNVKHNVRESDIFARIGGEEFVILMLEADEKSAISFGEKVCNDVEKNCFIKSEDYNIGITVSIGITHIYESDTAFKDIFARSDKALYMAKDEGRNRVCVL